MRARHLLILALSLTFAGGGFFAYKVFILGLPVLPGRTLDAWTVEARLDFTARSGRPIKAELLVPAAPQGFVVLDETFVSRGYGLNTRSDGVNRVAVWAIRRARGAQTLYYQVVVARDRTGTAAEPEPPDGPPARPELEEPLRSVVQTLVERVRTHSADIATFATETLQILRSTSRQDEIKLLLGGEDTPAARARAATVVLASAGINSRVAFGLPLDTDGRGLTLEPRLEVYNGERWFTFDPTSGRQAGGDDFLVWSRGQMPLRELEGGTRSQLSFAATANPVQALAGARRSAELKGSRALEFSLLALPVQQQMVYRVLLTIPIGALVIVVLRTLVGLKSFGTFAPVLMALAFRETQLLNGILLFSLIVAMGLSVRFYLERLKLLLVPRLASSLIVVVIMMAAITVVTHKLGIAAGVSVALFPMVILTMTIERMSLTWEEHGPSEAIQQALGSLVAASLGYVAMSNEAAEYIVFTFPELLLIALAGTLLLGRYTGYRLTELRRFAALAK